jgi:8-oxo-dGTP pyrophosphatase MutT (NUDIX family)
MVEEAAVREVQEETGLDVELEGLVGLYSEAGHPVVLAVFGAHVLAGTPAAGHEMLELGVFRPDDLPTMAFPHDQRIVQDWHALRQRLGPRDAL